MTVHHVYHVRSGFSLKLFHIRFCFAKVFHKHFCPYEFAFKHLQQKIDTLTYLGQKSSSPSSRTQKMVFFGVKAKF